MKITRTCLELSTGDRVFTSGVTVFFEPPDFIGFGGLAIEFPDRTPRDKLEAIAKAINDALDAARKVEDAARD